MSLKNKAVSGVFWTFLQQFSSQLIIFVVSLVLARLLSPAEFGLIGMISILIGIGRVIIDGGLTQSIIRLENPDDDDYSTVFYFNLVVSVLIYAILFFSAPLVADFFHQKILINVIRLYSLSLIISSFSAVQFTRLTKKLMFKSQMFIILPSIIISGLAGIIMAYNGFGVWSLVYSEIIKAFLTTIQIFFYSKWLPNFYFKKGKLKQHVGFGLNMTLTSIINVSFKNIYTIFIGRLYSPMLLGFYSRADLLKQLPASNIIFALNKVTFPIFVSIQDDEEKLRLAYKKVMQMVTFLMAPTMIFMIVLAEPIFRFLFTSKWLPAVPYFQILALISIFQPIQSYNLNILLVKGKSKIYLYLEILKKSIILLTILVTFKFGIIALLYGQVGLEVLFYILNSYFAGKYINYKTFSQFSDIFLILLFSVSCGLIVYMADSFVFKMFLNDFLRIFVGLFLGYGLFILFSFLTKSVILYEFKQFLIKKNKN